MYNILSDDKSPPADIGKAQLLRLMNDGGNYSVEKIGCWRKLNLFEYL